MWHIVLIGYIFVTLMFSIAQPSLARILIYLVFWTILPTLFTFWVVMTHRRNQRMKREEQLLLNKETHTHESHHTPD